MFLPTGDRQFGFWALRRTGASNSAIAGRFHISRQAVSRALLAMDDRVGSTLLAMARANQIEVGKINPSLGLLLGRSVPFRTAAVIFVSERHGMQVWYEHDGECGVCPRCAECTVLLRDYAAELGIRISRIAEPTKMAEELFAKVREMV